jgi:hypothetical protein
MLSNHFKTVLLTRARQGGDRGTSAKAELVEANRGEVEDGARDDGQ